MMITAIPLVCCGSFAYQAKKAQACASVPQAQSALNKSQGIEVHEKQMVVKINLNEMCTLSDTS
jgi:hypothetical protein